MNKCKHCGKDVEAGAKTCPHCNKSLEEAQDNKVLLESIGKTVSEAISPLKKSVDDIDVRVKKIEAMPIPKAHDFNIIVPEKYRGYELSEQGEEMREKFASRPKFFKTLSNEDKFKAFCKFMLDVKAALCGDVRAQMQLQEAAYAAKASNLVEGTDSLGGYLVPDEFQMDLVRLAREKSFLLQNATVLNMSTDVKKLPSEASLVSVTWEDEAASIDEQNPTFGQVTLTAKKLAGLTAGLSGELLMDTALDIVGMLTEQFMYAIGIELDNQALNGTGSPCSGVLTAACGYSVVMSTGLSNFSSISGDYLSQMIYKLSEEDAVAATFVYNRLIQHYIRTLKDSNNQYIWQKPGEGRPGTIWELPYIQSTKATGTTGASTAFVALGNWRYFYVGRRMGQMAFAADPYTNFATDLVRFRAITRWGMAIARSTAFVRLVTAS